MNISKYIDVLLYKLSLKYDIYYMEKITYKDGKKYKNYFIKIAECKEEFRNKKDLLIFLSEF